MTITVIICLAAIVSVWIYSHYRNERESPQFRCCHKWNQTTVWTTTRAITHRLTCEKCGKTFTEETSHVYYS